MTRAIVTRYKRPPRKRKAIALGVPAIVTKTTKRSPAAPPERATAAPPAKDGEKSAITSKKRLKLL